MPQPKVDLSKSNYPDDVHGKLAYAKIEILALQEECSSELIISFGQDSEGEDIGFDPQNAAHKIASIMGTLWEEWLKQAEARVEKMHESQTKH